MADIGEALADTTLFVVGVAVQPVAKVEAIERRKIARSVFIKDPYQIFCGATTLLNRKDKGLRLKQLCRNWRDNTALSVDFGCCDTYMPPSRLTRRCCARMKV
jgi:hypothetical protein